MPKCDLKQLGFKLMEKTPEELKQEADAIAAAALADKSLEDELSLSPKDDETVESLKARLAKAEEERNNYKTGLLKLKKSQKEGSDEDGVDDEDIEDKKDDIDVQSVATNAALGVIEKSNEKTAISEFTQKYPALKDPVMWRKVIENYNPKSGKGSSRDILEDLEAALILAKYYGGGKIAEKEITLNKFASVTPGGSSYRDSGSSEINDSTIQMGKMMGVSAEDLQKASEPGANEIQLT